MRGQGRGQRQRGRGAADRGGAAGEQAEQRLKPIARAASIADHDGMTTEATTSTTGCQPSAAICEKVMRMPSSATPTRSTSREVNSMPGLHGPSAKEVDGHAQQQREQHHRRV